MQSSQSQPSISHIKAHIDLKGLDACISQLKQSLGDKEKKKKHNFFIVKERFTYMIYDKRGYINIANIKHWDELLNVARVFATSFRLDEEKLTSDRLQVDNITASGDFCRKINLLELNKHFCEKRADLTFPNAIYQYRRNRFPAAFIKTRQCGTVILHSSGRYCIVGAKNLTDLASIYKWI